MHKFMAVILILFSQNLFAEHKLRPIQILQLDWSSQIVLSHVYGELLSRHGFSIEYLKKNSDSQWFLLSTGKADLQVEVWEGTMAKRFDDLVQRELIIDAGSHKALTREEWWYPAYVKEQCPGLPDWRALNDCASIFAETIGGPGVYFTGPWEKPDRARIRALQLNFTVVELENSDVLRQKLIEYSSQKRPLLIFNWSPNWVESVFEGEFVEFPAYEAACETDRNWGFNKKLVWDCGNPKNGWLKKAVSKELAETQPCALALIESVSLNNKHISDAAKLVDIDHLSPDMAAQQWIRLNQTTVDNWLSKVNCLSEH